MDEIHRFEILGAMYALKEINIEYYQVVNDDHSKACKKCRKLHKEKQKVSEAIEGENLPLIHRNCRCKIGSYVDNKKLFQPDWTWLATLRNFKYAIDDYSGYEKEYKDFLIGLLKQVELINIDGKSYIRLPDFQRNVFLNAGRIIDGTKDDKRLIELMKKCDSVGLTNDEYEEAVNLMKEGDSSVDFFKPIEYYEVGRDVTNEVWEIIECVKSEYSHLAGKNQLALWDFYELVRNGAPLDLKNQSQFKTNSTFIFEGRVVDADYIGNFAYGYIGRYFGIGEDMLFPGAGFAQAEAGTSKPEFDETYRDDPKDQYAVLEGMLKYEKRKENKKTE